MSQVPTRKWLRAAAAVTAGLVALFATACTKSNDRQPNAVFVTTTATTKPPSPDDLTATTRPDGLMMQGVCPDPLVVQLDGPIDFWSLPWTAMMAIDGVGSGGAYSAQMVHPFTRTPTGIRIELRYALPAGKSVTQALQDDPSVHIGVVASDVAVGEHGQNPVTYLAAPWLHDDRIVDWDAGVNPEAQSLADLSVDPKVTLNGSIEDPVIGYLVGTSLITRAQLVNGPSVAQFDNFLADPTGWLANSSARHWQFLAETGWSPYPKAIVATGLSMSINRKCFEALVPLIQRSVVEIEREPERMVANLGQIAARNGISLDQTLTMAKLRAAIDNGLLNRVDNQTVAEVTSARIEQALRADATSRRARGLGSGSVSKLRLQAKAMIVDLTINELDIPPE